MRIGVVGGAGKIGQLRIQSINENPQTTLAAVLDISQEAAKNAAGDAPAHTELEAFLDTDMDAVIVSTPPHVHEGACVAALEHGFHVLVEKPMASTPQACQRIVAAAEKAGRTLATGFNMRYYPAFAFVKDAVDSGKIGTLDHVRAFGGHEGLAFFGADWQYRTPESGGGAMWDVGIHITDMVRCLLGEVTSVYGVASENVWHLPGSEDNAIVVMKNPAGIPATYHATWNEWKGYQSVIEAYGDLGMVRGAYAPMHNMLLTQSKPGGQTTKTVKRHFDVAVREKLKSWKTTALLSFAEELEDFIKLTKGAQGLRIADGYAGMRAIEIADAVYQSTKTNEVVTLPVLPKANG
jgi:predicted dehydrogenase